MTQVEETPAKPVITRTQVIWQGGHQFEAGPEGRTHAIDADAKVAPGPVETLLNALATCVAVDIVDILAKRRTPAEGMTINVVGHRQSEAPRRLTRVQIEFRIAGAGIEREPAEHAISLVLAKYCSVAASLAGDIPIESTLLLGSVG